jgi:hypothetical protein
MLRQHPVRCFLLSLAVAALACSAPPEERAAPAPAEAVASQASALGAVRAQEGEACTLECQYTFVGSLIGVGLWQQNPECPPASDGLLQHCSAGGVTDLVSCSGTPAGTRMTGVCFNPRIGD